MNINTESWYSTASDEDCVHGLEDSSARAEGDACHYAHAAASESRKDAEKAKAEILRRFASLRAENARLRECVEAVDELVPEIEDIFGTVEWEQGYPPKGAEAALDRVRAARTALYGKGGG